LRATVSQIEFDKNGGLKKLKTWSKDRALENLAKIGGLLREEAPQVPVMEWSIY